MIRFANDTKERQRWIDELYFFGVETEELDLYPLVRPTVMCLKKRGLSLDVCDSTIFLSDVVDITVISVPPTDSKMSSNFIFAIPCHHPLKGSNSGIIVFPGHSQVSTILKKHYLKVLCVILTYLQTLKCYVIEKNHEYEGGQTRNS